MLVDDWPPSPSFCTPKVNQPTCSMLSKWNVNKSMRKAPEWSTIPHGEISQIDSGVSSSSSIGQSITPPSTEYSEEDFLAERVNDLEKEEDEEKRLWRQKVEPMTDEELDYVEWAHRKSKFLDIYREPSLRFYAFPSVRFALPKVPITGSFGFRKGDRRVCPETETVQTPSNIAGRGVCTTAENKVSEKSPPSPSAAPSPPPSEPVNEAGNFEISKMDVLSEQIWHFHNKITQKESTLTRKLSLRDMLYFAICPVFPMCGLYVVGSSLNGFGNDKSDMDLCLMITNKEIDQKSDAVLILNMILSTLQKMDWVVHQKLILAKVPILRIKFAAPYQDITVDLNANNSVAIRNTHLLCYYSSFDWRVRPLVSTVKEWAKRKGINDANRSSFTSYSLVLMVIHYLQCGTDPQILPSLQNKYNKRFNGRLDVRTLNVTQALPNMEPPWKYHDKSSLGELLIGFLKYFATKFDYNTHAISVREGKPVSRSAVMRPQPGYSNNVTWRSQWRCICIEEPFTFNNTAHSIYDEMVFDAIKRAFEEAFEDLDKTRDISCLLECIPITVIPPIHGATAFVCDGINKETILEAAMIHGEPTPSDLLLSNSGSSISLHTAELGSGSACNSMYGEDNEKENYQRPSSTESMSMRSHGGQRNPTTNGRSYNNSRHRGARQGPRGGANPIRYQQRGSS